MTDTVDIFKLLKHIDSGDLDFYESLSDAEKKSISMFVASRWQTCTKNSKQIVASNALVNSTVLKFGTKHSGLMYRLMLIASSGTEKHYTWVSRKKKSSRRPETTKIISNYYGISENDASDYCNLLTLEEVKELADAMGIENSILKRVASEYKL